MRENDDATVDERDQLRQTPAGRAVDEEHTLGAAQRVTWDLYWSKNQSARHLWNLSTQIVQHFGPATPLRAIDGDRVEELVRALENAGNCGATINRKLAALSKMFTARRSRSLASASLGPAGFMIAGRTLARRGACIAAGCPRLSPPDHHTRRAPPAPASPGPARDPSDEASARS